MPLLRRRWASRVSPMHAHAGVGWNGVSEGVMRYSQPRARGGLAVARALARASSLVSPAPVGVGWFSAGVYVRAAAGRDSAARRGRRSAVVPDKS